MIRHAAFALAALGLAGGLAFADISSAAPKKGAVVPKKVLRLYQGQNFEGQSYEIQKSQMSITTDWPVGSFAIAPGDTWELCDGERFKGTCNIYTENQTGLGGVMIRSARMKKPPKAAPATPPAQ